MTVAATPDAPRVLRTRAVGLAGALALVSITAVQGRGPAPPRRPTGPPRRRPLGTSI